MISTWWGHVSGDGDQCPFLLALTGVVFVSAGPRRQFCRWLLLWSLLILFVADRHGARTVYSVIGVCKQDYSRRYADCLLRPGYLHRIDHLCADVSRKSFGLTASQTGMALVPFMIGTVGGATLPNRLLAGGRHYRRVPILADVSRSGPQ